MEHEYFPSWGTKTFWARHISKNFLQHLARILLRQFSLNFEESERKWMTWFLSLLHLWKLRIKLWRNFWRNGRICAIVACDSRFLIFAFELHSKIGSNLKKKISPRFKFERSSIRHDWFLLFRSGEKENLLKSSVEKTTETIIEILLCLIPALPSDGPKITGGRPRYRIGEMVDVNCTSGTSKPAATLQWFINGEQVSKFYNVHVYCYRCRTMGWSVEIWNTNEDSLIVFVLRLPIAWSVLLCAHILIFVGPPP